MFKVVNNKKDGDLVLVEIQYLRPNGSLAFVTICDTQENAYRKYVSLAKTYIGARFEQMLHHCTSPQAKAELITISNVLSDSFERFSFYLETIISAFQTVQYLEQHKEIPELLELAKKALLTLKKISNETPFYVYRHSRFGRKILVCSGVRKRQRKALCLHEPRRLVRPVQKPTGTGRNNRQNHANHNSQQTANQA